MEDIKEQMQKLQTDIQESRGFLHLEDYEAMSRKDLKEKIESKEKQLAELQLKMDDADGLTLPRRSERHSVQTEKMLAYRQEELSKKEKRLLSLYDKWKIEIRSSKENLKNDITVTELSTIADNIEKGMDDVMRVYYEIRECATPSTELRRRIDACEAVTKDVMKIVNERLSAVDGDYDAVQERHRLRQLLDYDYAYSIYGTASQSSVSHHSESMSIAAKRADAAAELAAKETQYKIMQEEIKQKEKIRILEETHRKELEMQKSELERLQAERDMEAARARLDIYDKEIRQETDRQSILQNNRHPDLPFDPYICHQNPHIVTPAPATDMSCLAQAIQDSISINRLPMPTPTVFSGDPILYIEWKASFMSLVDRKGISSADKLYYLKKYVSGPAHNCLEGTFYRSDDDAYRDAWNKLNQRYGQPFVIQRAFRDKLSKWPKIQHKDAEGLRTFSDFLNACQQAMPHVKGLDILSDCEENQKLIRKVPDWLASRWNRQVTIALIEGREFPTFKDFTNFVSLEAEIACNPVTSQYALHSSNSSYDKGDLKEIKGNKANVFSTQTAINGEESNDGNPRSPCMWCKDNKHQLPKCPDFIKKSLEDRRTYVKDNKLCYGCVKPGHCAKECHHRHTCDTCKGRHPTCLHNENYRRRDGRERSASMVNTAPNTENEIIAATALSVTGSSQSGSTSMIVPVWVSTAENPSREQLVYALLDTQSDSTFINKEVTNELQADVYPVKLKLTTMLGENMIVKSERVSGLRVRGYNSCVHINLPPSYTKDYIPVNRDHIPTHETAKQWPHLTAIADKMPPLLSCEVGLLIGYNCPRTLAPRQVLTGKDNEPYAILTDLGWSIVGCSTPDPNETESSLCHRVTVKELPIITPMDVMSALESDFKDTKGDEKTVSQEDLVFLDKLKEGIRKNEQGHYEMPLPFKQRPHLPDNKKLAEIRLNQLRRRFYGDEKYKKDYKAYMKEVIERGDVEEVNKDGTPGEKWYIPHHGIYHPKRPEKRHVVFDCSERYNGISLNKHLLPRPDMMNNLTGVLMQSRKHPIALMCDVEKLFHQFHVQEDDRDYMHFLWWKDRDPEVKKAQTLQTKATSSWSQATTAVARLLRQTKEVNYSVATNCTASMCFWTQTVSSRWEEDSTAWNVPQRGLVRSKKDSVASSIWLSSFGVVGDKNTFRTSSQGSAGMHRREICL